MDCLFKLLSHKVHLMNFTNNQKEPIFSDSATDQSGVIGADGPGVQGGAQQHLQHTGTQHTGTRYNTTRHNRTHWHTTHKDSLSTYTQHSTLKNVRTKKSLKLARTHNSYSISMFKACQNTQNTHKGSSKTHKAQTGPSGGPGWRVSRS